MSIERWMAQQHWLPDPVAEKAKEVRDEKDMSGVGEAVRYMCNQPESFDV
jgi:hypothetical protein